MRKMGIAGLLLCCFVSSVSLAVPQRMEDCAAAALLEAQSGTVLMEKETARLEVAGLSRLPALLLACEAADAGALPETVRVSEAAAGVRGPTLFLAAGEEMAADDLFKGAAMILAGDALCALSLAAEPSEEAFLAAVRARLAKLGVEAAYTDRMGTDARLRARELAKLGAALLQSKTFRAYATMRYETVTHADGRATELASANTLLKSLPGCVGVATGSSQAAGYGGVFAAEREGTAYVCAVLGAKSAKERAAVAREMLEYAFSSYAVKTLARRGEVYRTVPVQGGVQAECALAAAADVRLVTAPDAACRGEENIPAVLDAPIRAGEVLGYMSYLDADGALCARVELTALADVPRARLRDQVRRLLQSFLHA